MKAKIIEFDNVKKSFQSGGEFFWALKGVSFKIFAGDFVAIMGHSGSGKSTLMNIMGCLDLPSEGNCILEEKNVNALNDRELAVVRNKKIGIIFQDYSRAILPKLSVRKNVLMPLIYDAKSNASGWNRRAIDKLRIVGIENKAKNYPHQLSGGEKQRVAIARALINDPVILLADEPTGNLDTARSREIMDVFRNLNDGGMTVVLITHEEHIAAFASRIITLQDGIIINDDKGGDKK
jgi:putative ABC transport system ATP-binding protein